MSTVKGELADTPGTLPALKTEDPRAGMPAPPKGLARLGTFRSVVWVFLFDILLLVIFGAASSNWDFLKLSNLQFLGASASESIILAVGVAMVLCSGEIDISPGANLVLSSVVGAKVMLAVHGSPGVTILIGLLACVATGVIFGLVNGFVVIYLRVNTFITTLATMGIGTGLALVLTSAGDLFGFPHALQADFGTKLIADVPVTLIIALLVALVAWITMSKTRFGLRILAMGSSKTAAARVGVSRARYLISSLAVIGVMAAIAGFIDIARFNSTNVSGHTTDSLTAVAGAIIGGTGLFGGSVSVWGAVAGSLLSVILLSGLVTIGANAAYQEVATGVVLIAAVALDQLRKARDERA